ncbi:MAG: MarR family protein [Sphingomonas bacterium]|nr:MarR family protein [Sphingomonas bacterium]
MPASVDQPSRDGRTRRTPPPGLLTGRIITLLDLLRRSGMIAYKREFGLSELEWRVMAQVGEHQPLSLNDLAELLSVDRGQLSRTVKAMVEKDLLTRKRRPGGPAIVIQLSANGGDVHARMLTLANARNASLAGDISPAEIADVSRILDVLVENAHALLEREREAGGL